MNHELTLLNLILEAGWIVQSVMLLLLLISVVSWAVIVAKARHLRRVSIEAARFEERFWAAGDMKEVFEKLQLRRHARHGMESIFEVGYREYTRQHRLRLSPEQMIAAAQRMMRVVLLREMDILEARLSFLATAGSISPYIGLFGTVIGIMNAFRGLGNVQSATLNMVAPGIAEALIATAMGLLAAIPAVVAYNRFANQIARLETRYQNFKDEFATFIYHQANESKSVP